MRRTRGWWRAGALMLALALVVVACDDDGDGNGGNGESERSRVVVGVEDFPAVLNNISFDSNAWTGWIAGPALARGYKLLPDFTYEPWVFEDDCTIDTEEPFTVSCRIREDASWSDGTPITADDFEFTYETIMSPDNAETVLSVTGYENITGFEVVSPTEFRMVFDGPYAAYRDLWAGTTSTILPAHALEGWDFNTDWNECICVPETGEPIGSGPFLVESFTPDQEVTLVKNDAYWDGEANLDEVVFVPTPDADAELNALDGDDVQVVYPQETSQLRQRLEAIDGVNLETGLGLSWEHLDLLVTAPGLDDLAVRRAIATALPRQDVVDNVARPVDDDATVQDNSIYVPTQDEYEPNWELYSAAGDVDEANAMLDAAGWTRTGDVRSRDGVELRFTIGTTAGDVGRESTEQIIQDRLAEIGIVVEIDNVGESAFFDRVDAFEYPMAIFANDSSPDPSWVNAVYPTDAPFNGTQQSNEQVDALLEQANGETDPDARAALLNTADSIMAEEVVAVIPLYQKPAHLAFLDSVSGLQLNVTIDGFTWNIEEWERTG